LTPEGKVKARVKQLLTEFGCYFHMPVQNGMGEPTLDFIVCANGIFAGIETKAGKQVPTKRQQITMEKMQHAGGWTFLVNEVTGLAELRTWLEFVYGRHSRQGKPTSRGRGPTHAAGDPAPPRPRGGGHGKLSVLR